MRTPFLFALALMTATGCKAQLDDSDWDGDGFTLEDGDCNDDDATVYPGAVEACDGVDANCDGAVSQPQGYYPDVDQDGFGEDGAVQGYCDPPDGWVSVSGDCNDGDAAVNPDADEVCDSQDNDCDDVVDEDPPEWWYDSDTDGYGDASLFESTCDPDTGYVLAEAGEDCDDDDPDIYPGAPELCDDVDQDCDKETRDDESIDATLSYTDTDTDGFGDPDTAVSSCDLPKGNAVDGTDCDDADLGIYPGAPEYCDGVDHDCDKLINEDQSLDALVVWSDTDGDEFGDPLAESTMCVIAEGFVGNGDDCDDTDGTSYPGADELCDGIDHDCDGDGNDPESTDATTWYGDTDSDDYGEVADSLSACSLPAGYAAVFGDCNDNNDTIYPDAPEYCDGVDHDCDKLTNEDESVDAGQYYTDLDEDDFGDDATLAPSCGAGPAGAVEVGGDCNDINNLIYPEAVEHCDGTDWDCDGLVNEGESVEAVSSWVDDDGDGYGNPDTFEMVCTITSALAENGDDCDDSSDLASPSIVSETCNDWLDNNCDGHADECVLQDMSLSGSDVVFEGASGGSKLGTALTGQVNLTGSSTHLAMGANKDNAGDGTVYLLGSDTLSAGSYDVSSVADAYILGSGSEQLGAALAAADLDADVRDELVVGAPENGSLNGAVYLFEGTLSGALTTADAALTLTGDVPLMEFGASLSAAPFTASQGALLIGGPYDAGAAYLFLDPLSDCSGCGFASDANSIFLGESTGDNAGSAVAVAGDVTCDGNADFLIGAPNHNGGDGAAYLMTSDNISAYDMKLSGINGFYTSLGSSVVGLGDVDNDGCDDFAVGAPGDLSAVFVYLGDSSIDTGVTPERVRLLGSSDGTGTNVNSAGDMDNDGIPDLLVGAEDTASLIYAATLFDGFDVADDAAVVLTGVGGSSNAGAAIANIGDVNEDGYGDLFIGAPGTDSPNTDQGATYLLFGLGL